MILKVGNSIIVLSLARNTTKRITTNYRDKKFLRNRIYASFPPTLHRWEFQFLTLSRLQHHVLPVSLKTSRSQRLRGFLSSSLHFNTLRKRIFISGLARICKARNAWLNSITAWNIDKRITVADRRVIRIRAFQNVLVSCILTRLAAQAGTLIIT